MTCYGVPYIFLKLLKAISIGEDRFPQCPCVESAFGSLLHKKNNLVHQVNIISERVYNLFVIGYHLLRSTPTPVRQPHPSMKLPIVYPLISVLFALLFTYSAFAQTADKRIDEIEHLYTQTNEAIAIADKEAPYSEIYVVEVSVNKTGNAYPAVGGYSNVTRFHYTFGNREKDPYPNRLLRATVVTKRAAMITSSEFYFNPAGQLVHGIVRTDGEEKRETRLYFAAGQLIRLIDGGREVSVRGTNQIQTAVAFKRESARVTALFVSALKEGL